MSVIHKDDVYVAVSPEERILIIEQIKRNQLRSGRERDADTYRKFWDGKHAPEKDIPTAIYLTGNGTFQEQYTRLRLTLTLREFSNYRRELIYQGIFVKQE